MKKQSYVFQKFQKKYFFFQRSFFDFFHWRSTNTLKKKKNFNFQQTQIENKLYPFEQEKIVFLLNKSNALKNVDVFQRKTKIKKTFENFQQSNSVFQKNNFFPSSLNESKNFAFDSTKKIRFQFLKKQQKKDKNSRYIQSKDSTFFHTPPKTSSFELFRARIPLQQGFANGNIPSFGFLKVGNFFPKKKHFQQYWIFPFLGVFVFFAQNSSIVFYDVGNKKQEKSHNFFGNFITSQKSFQNSQMNNLFFDSEKSIQEKEFLPLDFEVSFPSKDSKKFVEIFQKYEKNEFDEFFQFSTKIFQNSISFFPFPKMPYGQGDQNEQNVFQKMLMQNFLLQKDFQQRIETKRNTFQWTWFSGNFKFRPFHSSLSPYRDVAQVFSSNKTNFLSSSSFSQTNALPQKAEFFFENPLFLQGEKFSKQKKQIFFEKRKMLSTPIFEFSKNLSFLDEYQRKASFWKQNILQKDDFLFLNSFFSNSEKNEKTKFLLNPIFQKNLGLDSETFFSFFLANQKDFFEKEKTIFFFKNWGKTQKFWDFKPKQEIQKENFFMEVKKNPNDFLNTEIKNHKNLFHLDAIYFQKFLKKLDKTQQQIPNSDFAASQTFLKSDNFFPGLSEKERIYLNLKKQTLDSFLFQHYHLKYKKFHNFEKMFQKTERKFFFSFKASKKSFSKEVQKTKVLVFLKKKKFLPLLWKNISFFARENFQQLVFQNNQGQNSKISAFSGLKIFSLNSLSQKNLFSRNSHFPSSSSLEMEQSQRQGLQMKKSAFFLSLLRSVGCDNKKQNFWKTRKPFLFIQPILFDYSSQSVKKVDNFFVDFSSYSEKNLNVFKDSLFPTFHSALRRGADQNFSISETKKNLLSSSAHPYFFSGSRINLFPFFGKTSKSFKFSKKNENFTFESKTTESTRKETENPVCFHVSNRTFFEKLYKNLLKSFVFNFHSFQKFQELFIFETTFFEKPLLYSSSSKREKSFSFDFKTFSKKEILELNPSIEIFSLKYKKDFISSFHPRNGNFKNKLQKRNWKKEFSSTFSESPRKYEKVFQTFFSPLKIENTYFSSNFHSPIQKQIRLPKDQVFLKSFSNLLKKSSKNQNLSFFVFQKQKNLKTNFGSSRTNEKTPIFPFFSHQKNTKQNEKRKFFQDGLKIRTKNQLSPELLLKRDGFVFLESKNPSLVSSAQNTQNQTFLRIEKEKFLQKKRRLKKEKLETRRRKKRKRFFPRPTWLRMNLYKKFLKTRHSQKNVNVGSVFLKNQKKTFLNKTYGKNFQKWGFFWKKGFSKKFGFNKSFSKNQKTSISKNLEHYKISGDIFREFLRLSWKSSWFQTSFQPYTKKIQQSFQTIQSLEAEKNLFNSTFFTFSNFKSLIFQNFCENQTKSFLLEKSVVQKFSWYSNIRNSMNFNPVQKSVSTFSAEQQPHTKIQNIPEYNRILYARISEVLRNFKFSENTSNDFFFKQFQVQRRKNEKIFSASKNSFFTKSALFFEKFQVPSQPIIPAFSVFSSLLNDSSIKPTGDIPTLRALWAFQKTNLFQFQETNVFRNVWTFQKRTDTFKALKGTKKIMAFFRKYNGFETLPTNFKEKKNIHFGTNFEKTSFLLNKKVEFFDQMKQFDTRTLKKFQNAEKKVSLFGIQSFKQKSKISLRYWKFSLSKSSQKNVFPQKGVAGEIHPTEKSLGIKNTNQQNSAKSSLNFWWAQKPYREFDFLGTSFFEPFIFSFEQNEVEKNPFLVHQEFFNSSKNQEKKIFSNFTFLFIGALFFQFALFSSFFKIPEIRSVFKFQFLLFSKLWKSFFLIFFSLYNLLQKYTKNAFQIFQNSTYSLVEKKSFSFSEFEKRNFDEDSFFSRKNSISKISLKTYGFFPKNQRYFQTEKRNLDSLSKKIVFEFFPRFSFSQKTTFFSPATGDKVFKKFSMVFFEKKKDFLRIPICIGVASLPFQLTSPVGKWERNAPNNLKSFSVLPIQYLKTQKIYMGDNKNLSTTEKNVSFLTFSFLVFGKSFLFVPYRLFKIVSNFSTKVFEIVENFFFAVYKFLEKPAEFMIEFIAFVFLIEWSSDIGSFLPDSVESSVWKSSQKLFRPARIGTFAFNFLSFSPQNGSSFGPFHILSSAGMFTSANFVAFLLQKRLLAVFEHSPSLLFQPDIDILVRQRKGMLFWDIWAEILLKAAEKYNVNIPSFVTLKEEQEIFVEKLVRDSQFFQTFQSETFGSVLEKNDSKNSFQSFSNFLRHFVLQNSPSQFFDPSFVSNQNSFQSSHFTNGNNSELQKKLQQSVISNLFVFKSFENFSNIQNCKKTNFAFPLHKGEGDVHLSLSHPNIGKGANANQKNSESLFPFFETLFSSVSQKKNKFDTFEYFKNRNRWESNQYATFQSQETDFFLDIHLPKSLCHVHFLKYYEPAHFTLGSLICSIYAGVFPKQVSKNILVVGESGTAKTLFLQALAGETEMKIITENASRYAIVQRGVAVGMKFLRDVFDAIALQTPCFFVMEDLHIIGSKRPFLISENETGKGNLSSFGLEQQEVHETNQMIYQSSRHSITDFRRPYKGDFSMGIPTNFFLQTFYSSFLTSQRTRQKNSFGPLSGEIEKNSSFYSLSQNGSLNSKAKDVFNQKGRVFQNTQFFGENFSSKIQNFLSSPFPIDSLDVLSRGIEQNQGLQERENSHFSMFANQKNFRVEKIQSCLQFSKEQIFAPPATSPFTVLMMKEQKKLKPKKRVQETSWGGLSVDQILSYQKESSSVRAKVAVLAEKTLNLSRGKFDMITDFLVIIDSVRSNRGFVVFGTTHKPSVLDPALRRPGRFDETLSLSIHPNFLNRFEILKMNFLDGVSTFDFLDSSLLTENFSEIDLFNLISQTKLSFFHHYKYALQKSSTQFENFGQLQKNRAANFSKKERLFSKISPMNAFYTNFKSSFFEDFYTQKEFFSLASAQGQKSLEKIHPIHESQVFLKSSPENKSIAQIPQVLGREQNSLFRNSKLLRYSILPKGPSHALSLAYSKIGVFLAESNLSQNPTSLIPLHLDVSKNSWQALNFQQFFGNIFYDSRKEQNFQMGVFLAGKVSEFLVEKNISISQSSSFGKILLQNSNIHAKSRNFAPPTNTQNEGKLKMEDSFLTNIFEKPSDLFVPKFVFFDFSFSSKELSSIGEDFSTSLSLQGIESEVVRSSYAEKNQKWNIENDLQKFVFTKINSSLFLNAQEQKNFFLPFSSQDMLKKNFSWTAFGNDETWRSATPFLFSLVRKRFLFTKNLFLSKMLFFENSNQRRQPPSPPGSSILMPAKKYENFKRTENDFFQKGRFSMNEKIQMHQKQRFLKQLYNIPTQQYFRSEFRKNHQTLFSTSFQELAYLDSVAQTSSSTFFFQKKYVQTRHRFSHINQWWTGMFPEHTRESTFLSDVDWRTMFVSEKEKNTFEFLMDFPDSEQYYNPRNRRWFFKVNSTKDSFPNATVWSMFEKDLQYEIFYHFLLESFFKSFSYFEKQREMLDFFVYSLLQKGVLKEFDFLTTFSRF